VRGQLPLCPWIPPRYVLDLLIRTPPFSGKNQFVCLKKGLFVQHKQMDCMNEARGGGGPLHFSKKDSSKAIALSRCTSQPRVASVHIHADSRETHKRTKISLIHYNVK